MITPTLTQDERKPESSGTQDDTQDVGQGPWGALPQRSADVYPSAGWQPGAWEGWTPGVARPRRGLTFGQWRWEHRASFLART